jgi:hypothetical protein
VIASAAVNKAVANVRLRSNWRRCAGIAAASFPDHAKTGAANMGGKNAVALAALTLAA